MNIRFFWTRVKRPGWREHCRQPQWRSSVSQTTAAGGWPSQLAPAQIQCAHAVWRHWGAAHPATWDPEAAEAANPQKQEMTDPT